MAEYIKREAIMEFPIRKDRCDKERANEHFIFGIESVLEYVENLPAADVAPVVHGRWGTCRVNLETGNYEEQCTRCRNFSKEYGKPYCPNCGAKMDLEDGGGEDAAD